jgi:predicted Zn-dependent protease
MSQAYRLRVRRSDFAGFWLIVLMIFKVCTLMSAQPRITVSHKSVPSPASHSVNNSGSACDLGRVPAFRTKLVQKNLREQRAEYALGSKLAADVEQHIELMKDDFIVHYVNRLEQKIARSSSLLGCFVVKVLSDPWANAYSLPGGFIYVTTGLIDMVEDEDELAATLAHETAHVTARHLTGLDSEARIWGRLALAAGPLGFGLRRYLGPLLLSKLLRNKEFEADRLGLQYDIASGYNPLDFCRILQLAFPEGEDSESFVERLYDTHPPTDARVDRLQRATTLLQGPRTGYIANGSEFVQMKLRLAILKTAK